MSSSGDVWKEATAPDGKVYYYNERTGEAAWTKPADAELAKPPPPPPATWREALCRSNKKSYFYNERTGEVTWTRPAEQELVKPPPPPSGPRPTAEEVEAAEAEAPVEWDEQGQPIKRVPDYDEEGRPIKHPIKKPYVPPPQPYVYPTPYQHPGYGYGYDAYGQYTGYYAQPGAAAAAAAGYAKVKEVPVPPEPGGKLFVLRKGRDEFSDEDLRDAMMRYGEIEKFATYMIRDGGKAAPHKGYGFVVFKTTAAADAAFDAVNGTDWTPPIEICGQTMRVEREDLEKAQGKARKPTASQEATNAIFEYLRLPPQARE